MAAWVTGAAIVIAWCGVTFASRDGPIPGALHFTVLCVAGLVAGAVARRRGVSLERSMLTGSSLAVVPASFAGVLEWTSKPSVFILPPTGPRVAPFVFLAVLLSALIPSAAGAAVGWAVARRRSARRSG